MTNKIKVLDCTLRDGGYANNWRFGKDGITDIKKALEKVGVDFIELGLIQDTPYDPDRSIYDIISRVGEIIGNAKDGILYGALIEMSNYYPPELLTLKKQGDPQALRYSFWKRSLDEAFSYAEKIAENGYRLCCQPTRAEQYSDKEFAALCRRFGTLNPYAVYIVDTFGLLREEDLIRYAQIGHEYLPPEVVLGYHAHDNMGQAFRNVCAFLNQDFSGRTIQIDASISGMGRGAGNLRLEQILEHLNSRYGTQYNLTPIYEMWDKYIGGMMKKFPWGYDLAYFIASMYHCNPNYALFYRSKGLDIARIERICSSINGTDKYLYSDQKAEMYMEQTV